jgi:hypothetical protein
VSEDGSGVRRFHFTRHGSGPGGDAFDLFVAETTLIRDLFQEWEKTVPGPKLGEDVVVAKWDHGTVGKLLIEHASLRLAAGEEVTRLVRKIGDVGLAERFEKNIEVTRPIIDDMYDSGRGIQPMSLAITPEFVTAVNELHGVLRCELEDQAALHPVGEALAPRRNELRSARYISRHAPARPQAVGAWGRRFPFVVRVRTAVDRLAGFPWAESSLADRKLAERFDNDG